MKTPGQIAFEAYNESKGGLTYDGKPIPPWDTLTGDVGEAVKRAWEVAAGAVAVHVRDQCAAICDLYIVSPPSEEQARGGYLNAAQGIWGRIVALGVDWGRA